MISPNKNNPALPPSSSFPPDNSFSEYRQNPVLIITAVPAMATMDVATAGTGDGCDVRGGYFSGSGAMSL